jgi:hypothetical protein
MPQKSSTHERLTKHDLAASQRKTDGQLQDFIRSLRGTNGHAKRKVDLQVPNLPHIDNKSQCTNTSCSAGAAAGFLKRLARLAKPR